MRQPSVASDVSRRGSDQDPLAAFMARAEAARALVATDFDGTLSAIVPVPSEARPLPGALDALAALVAATGTVAVISGRSQRDLRRRLPVPGLRLLGDYGRPDPSAAERERLAAFNARAAAAVGGIAGARMEAKPGSTSVHYRTNPAAGPALLELLRPLAAGCGLDVRRGRLVVEVVPAGWDKARALAGLVEELDPSAVVFAGDDHGDRGCFTYCSTLQRPHLAIGVTSPETAPEMFAACDVRVEGPEANVALLSRLGAEWARRGRGRAGP